MQAFGHLITGDVKSAQKSSETAIEVALDPVYAQFPKITLGLAYFFNEQFEEAENVFQSIINFTEKRGVGQLSAISQEFLAPVLIAKGQMQPGIKLMEDAQNALLGNQRRAQYAMSEYILGEVNSQIATGPKPSLSIIAKNIGFLVKNVPFATKKAEEHFNKAIELFKEIGMKGYLGQAYLSLGLLYKASKKSDQARQCISEAINIFQGCRAEVYLKQAKEALDSLV
jgi:tetratricopeptide (TPR) repeat protein